MTAPSTRSTRAGASSSSCGSLRAHVGAPRQPRPPCAKKTSAPKDLPPLRARARPSPVRRDGWQLTAWSCTWAHPASRSSTSSTSSGALPGSRRCSSGSASPTCADGPSGSPSAAWSPFSSASPRSTFTIPTRSRPLLPRPRHASRIQPDYVIGLSDDAVPSMMSATRADSNDARHTLEADLRAHVTSAWEGRLAAGTSAAPARGCSPPTPSRPSPSKPLQPGAGRRLLWRPLEEPGAARGVAIPPESGPRRTGGYYTWQALIPGLTVSGDIVVHRTVGSRSRRCSYSKATR